jgi:hypothetical protein
VKLAGIVLALALGVLGFVVAFGVWSVGYCGDLTPDAGGPGTLRHDLCEGTSGGAMDALVLISWIVGALSPLLGMYWALRKGTAWPLVAATTAGAIPILTILILAEVLPQT